MAMGFVDALPDSGVFLLWMMWLDRDSGRFRGSREESVDLNQTLFPTKQRAKKILDLDMKDLPRRHRNLKGFNLETTEMIFGTHQDCSIFSRES